jgi:hypothetical protein
MARYAVINDATKVVSNVIEWDGNTDWNPPSGYAVIASATAGKGDTYENRVFITPSASTDLSPRDQEQADYNSASSADKLIIIARKLGLRD